MKRSISLILPSHWSRFMKKFEKYFTPPLAPYPSSKNTDSGNSESCSMVPWRLVRFISLREIDVHFLSLCLCWSLSLSLSLSISIYLSIYLSIYFYLSIYLSIHLSVYITFCILYVKSMKLIKSVTLEFESTIPRSKYQIVILKIMIFFIIWQLPEVTG